MESQPNQGDGIFTPIISPVADVDKTGRPTTIEVNQPEQSFSTSKVAGRPAGDSNVINFSSGSVGGTELLADQLGKWWAWGESNSRQTV